MEFFLGPSVTSTTSRGKIAAIEQWPELKLDRPGQYFEYLNAAVELTDRIVEKGLGIISR